MKRNDYSAGSVSYSFWFLEFKKVVQLLNDGKSYEEIKTMRMKLVEMKAKLGDIEECKGEITLFKESITNTETKINKLAQEITESKEEFKKSLGVVICPITNEKCEKLSK